MFDTRVSLTSYRRVGGALLVAASLLGGACGESQFTWPEPPQVAARYAALVPFRAGHLLASEDNLWTEYDPVGRRSEVVAALARLKGLGARQAVIEAPFAFTTEAVVDKAYDGFASYNVVYSEGQSRGAGVGACQRGDMGLVPYNVPPAWAKLTPAQRQSQAEAALVGLLQLTRAAGLAPVLALRSRAVAAHPRDCQACVGSDDCYDAALPDMFPACVRDQASDPTGLCRAPDGDPAYLDPTRDLNRFFTAYRDHVSAMARVAARGGAALLSVGGGSPYLSGGGQATFVDNSAMPTRRADLGARFRLVLSAARAALTQSTAAGQTPALLTYAAHNSFYEPRPLREAEFSQEWGLIDFLPALDVVAVDFYQPARATSPTGMVNRGALTSGDMLLYMRGHGFQSDGVGGVADLEALARARGFSVADRPVLLLSDGVPALEFAAAQPSRLPERPGVSADFEEQRRFIEARLLLVGEAQQRGLIGGLGLRLFQVNVQADGQPRFGGQRKALASGLGFDTLNDYLGLFDTPSEAVVRAAWAP